MSSAEKRVYCIRGATCVDENSCESIIENVGALFRMLLEENHLLAEDMVSIQFSMTPDIDAMNAASALRKSEFPIDVSKVPLFCSQEPVVKNMLAKVIRIMVTSYLPVGTETRSVYRNGAEVLRPDLANH